MASKSWYPAHSNTYRERKAPSPPRVAGDRKWRQSPVGNAPRVLVDQVGVISGLGPMAVVNPVIRGVDWDEGGAHWVGVDTLREWGGSGHATICDAWDTKVQTQEFKSGGPAVHAAASGGVAISFGRHKGQAKPYEGMG